MFYRAPAVLRHDGVAARVLRFSLGYDQRGAPVGAFCPNLRAIHDLHRQRGRLTQRETKRKSHKESTLKKKEHLFFVSDPTRRHGGAAGEKTRHSCALSNRHFKVLRRVFEVQRKPCKTKQAHIERFDTCYCTKT